MYCYRWLLLLGIAGGLNLVALPRVLAADMGGAHLESPSEGSFESGIGLIRGWICDAATVEVEIDGGKRWPTAYGTQRGDTASVCGDTNNGFGLTFNWNLFGGGLYSLRALADGAPFGDVIFRVATLGTEFLRDAPTRDYELPDFPQSGNSATVRWSEAHQNFVIVGARTPRGTHYCTGGTPASAARPAATMAGHLESPSPGSCESGIGLIRGWVCDATTVEVQIDGGERRLTGYGTQRGDTLEVCDDTNNGFGYTFNWNTLADGPHTLRAFADGVEFANVDFSVTTLGEEFLRGAPGCQGRDPLFHRLPDFPEAGTTVNACWSEAHQNFVIADTDIAGLDPTPDGDPKAQGLVFAEYNEISGDKYYDNGVWAFEARPRGSVFKNPVKILNRNASEPEIVKYDPTRFDYLDPEIQPPLQPVPLAGQYIAGWQAIHLIPGSNGSYPIILSINGSGYSRLTGEPPRRSFGTSHRVATHNVGMAKRNGDPFEEDFPRIGRIATEMVDATQARLDFLVDAEAFTGDLRNVLIPGVESNMDINATFKMRRDLNRAEEPNTGFAGMSSLFWRGASDTRDDSTDQAHDADTLVVTFSDGSRIVEPLRNPATPIAKDFVAPPGTTITSFALEQRDRDPAHYANYRNAEYASRSSLAIEGINASIPLKLTLQIFPAQDEFGDNVVTHLTLLENLKKDEVVTLNYRLRAF
jgi:hypothetical protein